MNRQFKEGTNLTANPLQTSLFSRLEKPRLTSKEVIEGMRECFLITHRKFVENRRPDLELRIVDSLCLELMNDVLTAEIVTELQVSPATLKNIQVTLDERFGFGAEPELHEVHDSVVNQLIAKMAS